MTRGQRRILLGIAGVLVAGVVFSALAVAGVFDYDVWKREKPLVAPVTVSSVHDGAITLADGRVFRPAGVSRSDGVEAADYDKALRVIVAQGVVVVRDVGDGTAFMTAEPRFYNWCGTRNADGIPWKRWAGSYLRCPVSELLVQTAYAKPALQQAGLTARERWRLEGVEHIGGIADSPTRISDSQCAFRIGGAESYLDDYDATLEMMWKPAPQ